MKTIGRSNLVDLALTWVREHNRNPEQTAIEEDTDLLAAGILDSLAFVDLLTHMEKKAGVTIDLLDADPEEFSTVGGLCGCAIQRRESEQGPEA